MPRWYYDPMQRKCLRFNYGGCRGNENNFFEEDTCMKTCQSVTGRVKQTPPRRVNDTSGAE